MELKLNNFSSPEFIESIKNKEPEARESLVRAYTSHLFKAALGVGLSEEQSNDIAHSTWITFFEVISKFQGRSHIRTFLFGIFYNKVSELRRSNLKFAKTDPIEDILESRFADDGHWSLGWPSNPHQALENAEGLSIIEECMDKLPEIQKAVFQLKVVEEEKSEEICNILDITSTNLRQILYRSKTRLKECVERKGER